MAYYFWFSIFGHSHSPLPLPPPLFVSRPFLIYTLKTLTLPNSLTLYNKNKDIYTHFYSVTFYYEDIYFIEFVRELKGWEWGVVVLIGERVVVRFLRGVFLSKRFLIKRRVDLKG